MSQLIGYTTSLSPQMGTLIKLDGGNCGQFFTRSPQTFQTIPFNEKDWIQVKEDIIKSKTKFVIHGSFLINFCKSKQNLNYAYKLILEDMKICSYLDCLGVIIHMGKNTEKKGEPKLTYEEAFQNYVQNIKHILHLTKNIPNKPKLILETGAGQGTEVATDLSELGILRKLLTDEEKERVKFCIDTCHIFTAGYDLRNPLFVDSLNGYIEMSLGWENVIVIHLNDSQSKLNHKVDRHADLLNGEITKTEKFTQSFIKFIKMCSNRDIPLVLETPGDSIDYSTQISILRDWIKS